MTKTLFCARRLQRCEKNPMKTQDLGRVINIKVVGLPLIKIPSKFLPQIPSSLFYRGSALNVDGVG